MCIFSSEILHKMMLLACLLLIWIPKDIQASVQFTTSGGSGPLCDNYRCLGRNSSSCVDGKCVCEGVSNKGLGHFVCTRPDEQYAAIFSDPMIRGFDSSNTKIPLICKFPAAHVSTKPCSGATSHSVSTTEGICDFKLFGWGRRILGKTYIGGIQVNVIIWTGKESYHHATRIEADAFNGQYIYTEDGNTNPFGAPPFGNPVTTIIPGLGSIHTVYDNVDNFARIVAEPCGVEVGIRGAEHNGSSLVLPPGMYIKVLEACEPRYLSEEDVLFSPPPGKGLSLAEQAEAVSTILGQPVTPAMLAVYKTFTGTFMQDFPRPPDELEMLADTVQLCDLATVYQAFNVCLFIIECPKFFRCFDKTRDGSKAIGLLGECIFSICDSNSFMCHDIQERIRQTGCGGTMLSQNQSILSFPCSTLSEKGKELDDR